MSSPISNTDTTGLHDCLCSTVNQIITDSERLYAEARASSQTAYVADLEKIQQAARELLGLLNTNLTLGTLPSAVPSRTIAHLPASTPLTDGRGETGFFSRFNGHILVADDNEENRAMLTRRLQRQGMKVEIAVNGQQALELALSQPFDVVLLDTTMPELDGFSVLRQIKSDPRTRHLPVIMISDEDELEGVIRCIEAGAEDYLPKPFNATLLRARITACLEKKLLREAEQRHLREIEETQRRLSEELAEAANYVRSILPPPCEKPLRVDWKYQPSTELGGDAFGYHWIDQDHFAVYLLDVCGHGVGASLLSVTAINVIRAGALPKTDFRDPGAVLSALNNAFPMEKQNNMYFTIWYGVYHAPSRTLRHASGGHPPALLLEPSPNGAIASVQLRSPGLIIGAMEGVAYMSQSCHIPPGASLFVLCDGCYEIRDVFGQVMEFSEFEKFMQSDGSQPDGLERLFNWVRERHGDGPLEDDFSIVRIQF